jgi:hypothetical protein
MGVGVLRIAEHYHKSSTKGKAYKKSITDKL